MPTSLAAALADRYRIERELGAGGMATVYLVEDLRHHRKVAIKVLHPDLAESLGAERFLREIETTANLRHPHILPLYDSGAVLARHPESAPFDSAQGRHRAERGDGEGPSFAIHCPFLEPLRGTPEFDRVLAKAARRVAEFSA